jgi:hypothetical protein
MVEIFKTDISQKKAAKPLVEMLSQSLPGHRIDLDLEDCDKVLRIEGQSISPEEIINMLRKEGFQCSILE